LPGYAEKYLGRWAKFTVTFSDLFGILGSLLVYMLLGGIFLETLLGDLLESSEYSLLFFAACSVFIFFGIRLVAGGELVMTILLIAVMIGIFAFCFPHADFSVLSSVGGGASPFLAYGIVLYALSGMSAVPEMKEILKENGRYQNFRKAIIWGTFIPVVLYAFFALIVAATTGAGTTEEAINGLVAIVGGKIILLGAAFGLLAVLTSFLVLGVYLKEILQYDYKMNKYLAWALVCGIPFILFATGYNDLVEALSVIGSFSVGLSGILVCAIYLKAKKNGDRTPEFSLDLPLAVVFLVALVFVSGMVVKLAGF